MKLFPQLLQDNYDGIVDADCSARVIDQLRGLESLVGYAPTFIKKFTKVMTNVLKSDPGAFDNRLAKKAYDFHLEGARLVLEQGGNERRTKLAAHIQGHAQEIACYLHEQTGDPDWLVEIVNTGEISGDLIKNTDPAYAVGRYTCAGKAALKYSQAAKEKDDQKYWIEKGVGNFDAAFDLMSFVALPERMYVTHQRWQAYGSLSRLTNKVSDRQKYVEAVAEAAKVLGEHDPDTAAQRYYIAAQAAISAAQSIKIRARNKRFLKLGAQYLIQAEELAEDPSLQDKIRGLSSKLNHVKSWRGNLHGTYQHNRKGTGERS